MKNSWLYILMLLVMVSAPASARSQSKVWGNPSTTITLQAVAHPRLFIQKSELIKAKERAGKEVWAGNKYKSILLQANEALRRPLSIPDKPGEWSQHFTCKTCGINLNHQDGKNVCSRCKKEYTGWPYDGVIAGKAHIENIGDIQTLGLAWQFTGDRAYADKGKALLSEYAHRYLKYPIHDFRGGQAKKGARLFAQTLDESVRMISMVWGYDLILDSPGMTPEDRTHIENNLFRAAAEVIARNDMGISNWQSWHNAAIAAIGFTLGDKGMVDHAVNGKSGIRFQMKKSVLEDGFWYEGTASYHFYALDALQKQALAMKSAGMNLYQEPVFRSLYAAPLDYTFPDMRFPAVNDSDPLSIQSQAEYYEMAYAWYDDPSFAKIASAGGRKSLDAFLWGKDALPADSMTKLASKIFSGLGAAMLRQHTPGNPLAVHLDYGPHGGGHGHPDKLGIIFFANGKDVMPDPGRLSYSAPLHKQWYTHTVAHNTVTVDGKDQSPTTARLVSHDFSGNIQMVTAATDTAYQDVTITRSLALAPEYLLDVVVGQSTQSHTWDLAYHIQGKLETSMALTPVNLPEQNNGYGILKNVQGSNTTGGAWAVTYKGKDAADRLTLAQADTAPRNLIFAEGVFGKEVVQCPVAISRQKGTVATWISLVVPGNEKAVTWDCRPTAMGWLVTVKSGTRTDSFEIRSGELALKR